MGMRALPECPVLQLICNTYQADSLSITQANTSAATGYIIKIFDYGSAPSMFRYNERTYPRGIMEIFGYLSLLISAIELYGKL